MLIFMQVWERAVYLISRSSVQELGSYSFQLDLYGNGQAASQRKKEQKLHARDAES